MLPFTMQEVIEAYERHPEIEPIQNCYVSKEDGLIVGCCPLSILAIDAGHGETIRREFDAATPTFTGAHAIKELMGWDTETYQLTEFTRGFDGYGSDLNDSPRGIGELVRRVLGMED